MNKQEREYLESISDGFKEDIKALGETFSSDLNNVESTVNQMNVDLNRELGGVQQAIVGQNARIKKVEKRTEKIKKELTEISVKHPNGSLKKFLWRFAPWLLVSLLTGAAFVGYAFFVAFDKAEEFERIENNITEKVEKRMKASSNKKNLSDKIEKKSRRN